MLIFDPQPASLRWFDADRPGERAGAIAFEPGWEAEIDRALHAAGTGGVAYVLPRGGVAVREPAGFLTPRLWEAAAGVADLCPANALVLAAARHCLRQLPEAAHVLLCDTAYFADLPAAASAYALPYTYFEQGVRRCGADGLLHQWAYRQVKAGWGLAAHRIVSLRLGDEVNAAAIRDGRPIETSAGFTPAEGILSPHGCGDIDPSVAVALRAAGMPLEEIEAALTEQGGISALMGRPVGLPEMASDGSPVGRFATEAFLHSVLLHLGACMAALSGLDVLVFTAEDLEGTLPLMAEICDRLAFIGLARSAIRRQGQAVSPLPGVGALALQYDRQQVLAERAREVLA